MSQAVGGRPNPRRRIDWRLAAGAVGAILALASFALPATARSQARTALVSANAAGEPANAPARRPSVSADGRRVAFDSPATNLVAGGPPGVADIFVRDLLTGELGKVSVSSAGVDGNGPSTHPSISASGRFVAFRSTATNLVPGDANDAGDVFVHDLRTGETRRVSVGPGGREANGGSFDVSISANGRRVAFASGATNLIRLDLNGVVDVFVRNWGTGKTRLASRSSRGAQADKGSWMASISANGRAVAFASRARNLVGGRTNAATHVYIRNMRTAKTRRVSKSSAGVQGDGGSRSPSVSGNGRVVAFSSGASNLTPGETRAGEIFIHNRKTGRTRQVSVSSPGLPGRGGSMDPSISAGGLRVVFESTARLVGNDTNRLSDIYLRDRRRGRTRRVSVSSDGEQADGSSSEPAISGDGRWTVFSSFASSLVAGDSGDRVQVFSRGPLR